MDIPLLKDVFIIFALAVVVAFVCHKVKVPTIVGFLVTGVLAGPTGLKLVHGTHEVEVLAEIGVILLLFTIGIEFSLASLMKIRRLVLVGGSLQVLLTTAVTWVLATLLGQPMSRAVFLGFLVSLSSTAIVLKILQERAEVDAPHGRAVLGVLILQDIAIVPMMLLAPLMAGTGADLTGELLQLVLKGAGVVLVVAVGIEWVVPWWLRRIAGMRSDEMFLLGVAVICFGVAWLTFQLGLSLALGAFLAGLIISESDYSHRALGNVLPFRDVFTSFFFVSIGMLLDLDFALAHAVGATSTALFVLVLKALAATAVGLILGMPLRVAVLAGLALAQVGEFSFVLAKAGMKEGLLTDELYQYFLVVSLLTMAAAPFVLAGSRRIAERLCALPLPESWLRGRHFAAPEASRVPMRDHVVIVGYGVIGRNLARSAKLASIPYKIIEINDRTVREEKRRGEPIVYGDASQAAVLEHVDLALARVLVVAIPDAMATRRVVEVARRLNPSVNIIARTRFVNELDPLRKVGANDVVPEEFEAAVAIFTRVLAKYLVPSADIERYVAEARSEGYQVFRGSSTPLMDVGGLNLSHLDVDVRVFRLGQRSGLVGSSLGELDLRRNHDVSVLLVRRGPQVISNPAADFHFASGDVVVVLGDPEKVAEAAHLFEG